MKKLLLTLALGAAAIFSSAAQTTTETFGKEAASWYTTVKANAADKTTLKSTETGITYNSEQAYLETNNGYLMLVGKSVTPKGYIKFKLDFACSNITIYSRSGASGSQAVTVSAGETAIKENTKIPNTANGNLSIDVPEANQAAGTEFTIQASANYNVQITKIEYTQVGGVVKEEPGLSFPEATYTIKLGDEFTAPELTKATDAAPKYTSSKEEVATVDAATGAVTVLAVGTTTITATVDETATFKAGSASYTLVVEDPNTFWAPDCKDTTNPEFTFETISGDFEPWTTDTRYGLKASAYSGGAANASDAVAASPVLDFTKYTVPMTLNYRQALNQFKVNGALIDCTDEAIAPYVSIVAQLDGETEWTKIGDVNAPTAFNWNFYDGAEIDLAQFAGKKVKIGFRYVSTTECAGTWEIDHVVVKAQKISTGVAEIETAENAPVEYFNLQGVRVANPENGLYIRRQGNKVSKVIVK